MRSLRARLFVYLIGGAAAVLLVAGLVLRTIVADALQKEFDRALLAKARGLVALTEQEAGQIEFEFDSEHMPEFGVGADAEYFELWLADGSLIQRSAVVRAERPDACREPRQEPSAGSDAELPGRPPARRPTRDAQIQIDFVPSVDPEDEPAETQDVDRTISRVPAPAASSSPTVTLLVARERQQLDAAVHRLELTVAGLGVGLMLALAGLMQLALRVGLRSLDRLTGQVRALDVTSLDGRVDVKKPPREIAVVVEQVNALLARLEAGFKRERRLSSDIAHELKTPIAELRNLSEVGARWPEDRASSASSSRMPAPSRSRWSGSSCISWPWRAMTRAASRSWTTPVWVAEVVDAAWKPLASEAAAKGLTLRQEIARGLRFETDPEKFALVVSNLSLQRRCLQPTGHRRGVRVGGDGGARIGELQQPGREPRAPGSCRDVRSVLAEGRGTGRRAKRGAGAGAGAGHGGSSRHRDRDAAPPRPDLSHHALEARPGLRPDQKRNCTSARTTQAPPLASGNAAPGRK